MLRIVHPVAGLIAILTIATFWLSTAVSELFASEKTVVAVKTAIPWGFLLLVPALVATGGSGFLLSKGQRTGRVGAKLNRMPFIALNGLLVLIPSAFFLASKATTAEFDAAFYTVQGIELVAGAINISLLGLSMRDGMKLTQWRRRSFLRPATIWRTSLVGSEDVAKDTKAFHFKKPDGFRFDAGQSIYVALPHLTPTDTKGRVRTFSIASAPQDAELVIATRLTEAAFKRNLESLPLGSSVEIEGPYGDLTLHNDTDRPAVFLAGGIGITPFRSIIRDATERSLPYNLYFFYSNRRPEDAAFLSEMRELERRSSRFKLVATVTDAGNDAGWSGERGYLTREMIAKHVADITKPIYYLAGPPAMISAMETVLRNAGVRRENVRAEEFSGY